MRKYLFLICIGCILINTGTGTAFAGVFITKDEILGIWYNKFFDEVLEFREDGIWQSLLKKSDGTIKTNGGEYRLIGNKITLINRRQIVTTYNVELLDKGKTIYLWRSVRRWVGDHWDYDRKEMEYARDPKN